MSNNLPQGVSEIEAGLLSHTLAVNNMINVLVYQLTKKGILDRSDIDILSAAYCKPLDTSSVKDESIVASIRNTHDDFMIGLVSLLKQL